MDRPVVLVTEPLAERAAAWLAERADVRRCAPEDPAADPRAAVAAALVVRTYTNVDAALLARMPALRVVGRAGVGIDNIDVAACRTAGVEVVYTPAANTQAVVEFVFAVLLDLIRPRPRVTTPLSAARWRAVRGAAAGRQLDERVVGVLGLGRIGQRVAAAATALGCRVIGRDLLDIPHAERGGAAPVSLEALFEQADIVSIHVDGRPGNRGLVGADLLGRLPPGAVLVNTSRGFVVDKEDLAAWLARRPDSAALLDVHDPEPIPPGDPLLALPNAVLYPHIAGRSRLGLENMSWVVRDVVAVLQGAAPRWPAGSGW